LNQNLLDINAQIKNLMVDLSRLTQNYKLSQELLSLEEESNRNLETQYREGKVTYLDLITSLNSLLDAKVQFYSSYFEALQGVAKHKYFEGRIYETISEK
jgi:outer membrane protein TolC